MHGGLHKARKECQVKIEEGWGRETMLFMVAMTLLFPVEEMVGELGVHTAGNEEMSAGRSFHSPVNCGTVTHICTHTKIHTHPIAINN